MPEVEVPTVAEQPSKPKPKVKAKGTGTRLSIVRHAERMDRVFPFWVIQNITDEGGFLILIYS